MMAGRAAEANLWLPRQTLRAITEGNAENGPADRAESLHEAMNLISVRIHACKRARFPGDSARDEGAVVLVPILKAGRPVGLRLD